MWRPQLRGAEKKALAKKGHGITCQPPMKLSTVIPLVALVAACMLAAPAEGAEVRCYKKVMGQKEVGRPYFYGNGDSKAYLEFSEEHDGRLARAPDGNVPKLAFYQCVGVPGYTSPVDGYRTAGQVRSAKNSSLCMTIGGIDNRANGRGYNRKNGYLTLLPCANTTRDELMERQWFDRFGDLLRFRGKDHDEVRSTLHFHDDVVYLDRDPKHQAGLWMDDLY